MGVVVILLRILRQAGEHRTVQQIVSVNNVIPVAKIRAVFIIEEGRARLAALTIIKAFEIFCVIRPPSDGVIDWRALRNQPSRDIGIYLTQRAEVY